MVPKKLGPLHKVQFVIEFVGPRSVPAATAAFLLSPQWFGPLGQPQAFAMRASDLSWQYLTPSQDGSYDSLALTWDLLTPAGAISEPSAKNLLRVAEDFGPYISRRALPIPTPPEIPRAVAGLQQIRDALDIGFTLSVVSNSGAFSERELWIECARLGLEFHSGGFQWRIPGHAQPLLTVTPFGHTDAFSLSAVQARTVHPGVTIGFHLPASVAPTQGLEGCFRVATYLARILGGTILDESDRQLTDLARQKLFEDLRQALTLYSQAGMTTGSPEVLRLYGIA